MANIKTNQHGLKRQIPPDVAFQVRSECGFGCVVCGNAVYEYEHIDPPFAEAKQHEAARIALVCGGCHSPKTRGFTSADLIKAAPR